MGLLKGVGYTILSIAIVLFLLMAGGVIAAFLAIVGVILTSASVIAFIAICIKEYCESKPTD